MGHKGCYSLNKVTLQCLGKNFKSTCMEGNENVQSYVARISLMVSQMTVYGVTP